MGPCGSFPLDTSWDFESHVPSWKEFLAGICITVLVANTYHTSNLIYECFEIPVPVVPVCSCCVLSKYFALGRAFRSCLFQAKSQSFGEQHCSVIYPFSADSSSRSVQIIIKKPQMVPVTPFVLIAFRVLFY